MAPGPLIGPTLVLWTLVAPVALGFDGSAPAVAGHIAFAMAVAPLTVLAVALRPALPVCALAGVWLVIAPWASGYAGSWTSAWLNDLLVGALLTAWSIHRILIGRTEVARAGGAT